MKSCTILYNEPKAGALADELDVLDQVEFIEKHLKYLGIKTSRRGITNKFMEEIASVANEKPDFAFNLVESINNKGEISYFIPALLSLYNVPYTGNPHDAIFATSSKTLASKTMKRAGIINPGYYLPSQYKHLLPGKKYIVKPIWEDGSMGITANSVFECKPGYEKRFSELDDSHWFIEEFIDGREFNISILAGNKGPEVLPPAEILFLGYDENRPKIVDFKAKWETDSFEYSNTVRNFPGNELDKKLSENLINTAIACWNLFRLKGYARIDTRVDSDNNVNVIEINANPCIAPDGGFVAATEEAGYNFKNVVERIIADLNN
jgi:D-alanine-D-alanine ligase